MMEIHRAAPLDADAAMEIVGQSIAQLCVADHRHDPETLARWLANKTPASFRTWLADPENFCVVAKTGQRVMGVGLLHRSGELKLFYLAPGSQRQGMGTMIHAALEDQARLWGLRQLHLQSTDSARPFYEALGYRASGAARTFFGVLQGYPYTKTLQPTMPDTGQAQR